MQKDELKKLIKADTYRYYAGEKKQIFWNIRNVTLRYTIVQRKAHYYSLKKGMISKIMEIWYRYRLNVLSRKYLIQIPYPVIIGKGLNIVHYGRVIVAPTVCIGDNCNIFTGVTIGSTVRGEKGGFPNWKLCMDRS